MELRKTIKNQNPEAGAAQVSWIGSPEVFVERFVDPPQEQRGKVIAFPSEVKQSAQICASSISSGRNGLGERRPSVSDSTLQAGSNDGVGWGWIRTE
jgi:hypothetical protein